MSTSSPHWFSLLVSARDPKARLPGWMEVKSLPQLVAANRVLEESEIHALLHSMQELMVCVLPGNKGFASPLNPPGWVQMLKRDAEPGTLDMFILALHTRFHAAERPGKDRWVYAAVALLGGDGCAIKIGAQVRQMAEDLNRGGANLGIEILKVIGTDTAITQLDMLTRKVRRNSVRVRAQEAVNGIAQTRGLSLDELGDRIIPDRGLDEQGGRCFDFGGRRFWLVMGRGLTPQVRDESGNVRKDLPATRADDDERLAAEATAAWKLLKKSLKDNFKLQADRLELAMVSGRSWSCEDFRRLFATHPVMRHLAQLLVWGIVVTGHSSPRCFRVAEDLTFCDENDEPVNADGTDRICLVHPLHLDGGPLAKWGQLLADYGILPPFDQVNRSIHALEVGEGSKRSLARFNGRTVHAMSLLSKLTRMGWERGQPLDAGFFSEHSKHLAGGVTAVLQYQPGIPIMDPRSAEPQQIDGCAFYAGTETDPSPYSRPQGMPLAEVPAIALSETIRDLALLTINSGS